MTCREVLAEAQKLSEEEKLKLANALWQEVEHQVVTRVFPVSGTMEILTPTFVGGSTQSLLDLLEEEEAAANG